MDAVIISNFQNAISASASTTKSYNPAQENKCFTRLINEDKCEHTEIFPKKGCEGWVYFLEEGVSKASAHGGVQFWNLIICIKKLHDI